jgi:hypothetical protein
MLRPRGEPRLLKARSSSLSSRSCDCLLFFSLWFSHILVATPAAAATPPISAAVLSLDLLRDLPRLPDLALDLSRKCFTTPAVAAVPSAALATVDRLLRRLLLRTGEGERE